MHALNFIQLVHVRLYKWMALMSCLIPSSLTGKNQDASMDINYIDCYIGVHLYHLLVLNAILSHPVNWMNFLELMLWSFLIISWVTCMSPCSYLYILISFIAPQLRPLGCFYNQDTCQSISRCKVLCSSWQQGMVQWHCETRQCDRDGLVGLRYFIIGRFKIT